MIIGQISDIRLEFSSAVSAIGQLSSRLVHWITNSELFEKINNCFKQCFCCFFRRPVRNTSPTVIKPFCLSNASRKYTCIVSASNTPEQPSSTITRPLIPTAPIVTPPSATVAATAPVMSNSTPLDAIIRTRLGRRSPQEFDASLCAPGFSQSDRDMTYAMLDAVECGNSALIQHIALNHGKQHFFTDMSTRKELIFKAIKNRQHDALDALIELGAIDLHDRYDEQRVFTVIGNWRTAVPNVLPFRSEDYTVIDLAIATAFPCIYFIYGTDRYDLPWSAAPIKNLKLLLLKTRLFTHSRELFPHQIEKFTETFRELFKQIQSGNEKIPLKQLALDTAIPHIPRVVQHIVLEYACDEEEWWTLLAKTIREK